MSQASGSAALVGKTLGGKYKLLELIGEGAMGAVFRAEAGNGRIVAVKTLSASARQQLGQEALARFLREAQVSSSVHSPNVVEVIDGAHDPDEDIAYLVMELMKGGDLDQLVESTGALRPEIAVRLIIQAARGLAAAHAQGIVHRDIKPANIFLHREGERVVVKVCDFGVAKDHNASQKAGLTVTSSVLGSPMYMSPEQLLNAKQVDHRADIWGLAMAAYDTLAGEPALGHIGALAELVMAVAREQIPKLSETAPWLDPALAAAVSKALQRDPKARYQSMEELAAALEPFAGGTTEVKESDLVPIDPALKGKGTHAAPAKGKSEAPGRRVALGADRYIGSKIANRYTLERVVEQGENGWVYDARTTSGRPCLVRVVPKALWPEGKSSEDLGRAAKAGRDVRHPSLLRVLDAGVDNILAMPYVVLEHLEQVRTLEAHISENGKLAPKAAARIFVQIARGLAALHKTGGCVGDLRPSRVLLVDGDGPVKPQVKLAWGEARLGLDLDADKEPEPERPTTAARYMAPEQARATDPTDARADVWAFCVCLFEAMLGKNPWSQVRTMGDLIFAICTHGLPAISVVVPGTPEPIVAAMKEGFVRSLEARPRDIMQVARHLEALADLPPEQLDAPAPPPDGTPEVAVKPAAKSSLSPALIIVIIAVAIAAIAVALLKR